MMRFALRGLAGRKLRTVLTALSIILGVAMVTGTFVLTDSITNAFSAIFSSTYKNTDAVVTGKSSFKLSGDNGTTDPSFAESVLPKVEGLSDVEAAIGGVQGDAHLIGKDGKAIAYGGSPNIGFSVDPTQPRFNSLTLAEGAWPKAGEVIVDKSTAGKEHLDVGQTIGIQSRGAVVRFRISGIAKYGAVSSIGGATLAGFDLRTAQSLFGKVGKLDQIRIAKKSGVSRAAVDRQRAHGPAAGDTGANGRRAGIEGCRGRQRVPVLPAEVPARLRRRGALRRRVRDCELALDHDRPANTRIRDAPDAWRIAPAGAVVGARRVSGDRDPCVGYRAFPGASACQGTLLALRHAGLQAAEQRASVPAPDDHRFAPRRDSRDRAGEPSPGLPRHACASDRGRSRGSGAASRPVRALPCRGCDAGCGDWIRPCAGRAVLRARDGRRPVVDARRRATDLHGCSALRLSARPAARARARLAGDAVRRCRGRLGARQRAAKPTADCVHCGRADDRAGARHPGGGPGGGDHQAVPGRRRPDLHGRLRDHGAEQLRSHPAERRERRRQGTRRGDDRKRTRRRRLHRPGPGARQRHPGDRRGAEDQRCDLTGLAGRHARRRSTTLVPMAPS